MIKEPGSSGTWAPKLLPLDMTVLTLMALPQSGLDYPKLGCSLLLRLRVKG